MLCINYKVETNNLIIRHSLEYIDGKLIDILDIDLDNLKIDKKKIRKILLFITLIISTKIRNLQIVLMNCIYQLKVNQDIF